MVWRFLPLVVTFACLDVRAQLVPQPTILSVFGGKPGTTVATTLSGANLNQTSRVLIGGGLSAEVVSAAPGTVAMNVTIPPQTPVGLYDLRVVTPGGASTPAAMFFHVSSFPTFMEAEPNNSLQQHNQLPELPLTIDGLINGNEDRDFFHFAGRRGQHLVCETLADRLVRPAGTAPLNGELALYDEAGKVIATGLEREPGHTDCELQCDLPADGHYTLEVRDEFYRGAGVFHYRVNVGFQPVVEVVTPAVVARGQSVEARVVGRNLADVTMASFAAARFPTQIQVPVALSPAGVTAQVISADANAVTLRVNTTNEAPNGALDLRLLSPQGASNALKFLVLDTAGAPEPSGNNEMKTAMRLALPCAQTARRDRKGQPSWFAFKARQGERWILEVLGRRLLSGMDAFLTLYDANGKELASNDDSFGADPRIDFNVGPAGANDYYLRVHDMATMSAREPDSVFVLVARAFKPDFTGVANPENPNLVRGGAAVNVQLTPARIDGYNGPIELVAEGLPSGVTFTPDKVNQGQGQINLQFKADANAPLGLATVRLRGKAVINNETIVRDFVAVSPYQFGNNALTRPLGGLMLTVVEPFNFALTPAAPQLMVTAGANGQTQLKVTRAGNFPGNIQLAYAGLSAGLTIQPAATGDNNLSVNLTIAAAATTPAGAHDITITGTSNVNGKNEQRTATLSVIVQPKS